MCRASRPGVILRSVERFISPRPPKELLPWAPSDRLCSTSASAVLLAGGRQAYASHQVSWVLCSQTHVFLVCQSFPVRHLHQLGVRDVSKFKFANLTDVAVMPYAGGCILSLLRL